MTDLYPCITFQINLQTQDASSIAPVETLGQLNALSDTRSTWLQLGTLGARELKHGEKFTVCGQEAIQIQNQFTTGDNPILVVCEIDPDVNCVPDIGGGEETATAETATATATMMPTGSASAHPVFGNIFERGAGFNTGAILTLTGGTFTTVAKLTVSSVGSVLGQTQAAFTGGELTGTFTGGESYLVSSTITMNDGTIVVVDAIAAGVVTEFTITTASTSGLANDTTLTQSFTSAEFGTGFTLTLDTANQGVFSASYVSTEEVPDGEYTVLPSDPVSTVSTGEPSVAMSFNAKIGTPIGGWGVRNITVTDGGVGYTSEPVISFGGAGGVGTTASATVAGGAVTSITRLIPGNGYTERATVIVAAP